MKIQVEKRLADGIVTQAAVDKTHKDLDMGLSEYVLFQEMKSVASMDGTLTLEEAQTVYMYLGESLETYNRQPVEVKAVLTKLMQQLLEKRIGRKAG